MKGKTCPSNNLGVLEMKEYFVYIVRIREIRKEYIAFALSCPDEKAGEWAWEIADLPPPGGFLLRLSEKVTKDTNLLYVTLVSFYS